MAVPNSDFVPDPFPGISAGTSSAPGSAGPRTSPPDDHAPGGMAGIPGVGTPMALGDQAGTGHTTSTSQAGQTSTSAISPGPASDYTSAGPEPNRTDHFERFPWQQSPGGQ